MNSKNPVWEEGHAVMDSASTDQRFPELDPSSLLEERGLTPREVEVLEWVARGKTNNEIGLILEISPRTASKHLEHIYTKLGVESRTAAVVQFLGMVQQMWPVRQPISQQ